MPPLLDATGTGRFHLAAQRGTTAFVDARTSETWGFNQPHLGPTLRIATGQTTAAEVQNTLDEPISVHWHGLMVPGDADGGPHQTISQGETWTPELSITQPTCTAWYHSHVHGSTARQVQKGLAGVLQIVDGQDEARGLPNAYGVDDLTLVLQDRRFDRRGQIDYAPAMPDQMMGFMGDTMVVNGQVGRTAVIPQGLVRLRLVNGSNARIYPLSLSDGREMHLIATDNGYLDRPITLSDLTIAPGERFEVLIDFSDGRDIALVSAPNPNEMMGGMMGGGSNESAFVVLPFAVDPSLPATKDRLPDDIGGSRPQGDGTGVDVRNMTLDMQMGMGMMMRRANDRFSINGAAFAMDQINFDIPRGTVERWRITADMMMHPFHIHGVSFQVLSQSGRAPAPQNTGWKDTMLVHGSAELLVRFDQGAARETPFMYHCHILEHEDGGMMGQFTVG
ncbi:multicopper oxidase domain-containing protein [Octadecabacter sp. R77987]|uniref:multicopper oxidase domain-containing protein n=1 Tax=Octadecabacter sp. R77987 TaxID=3093874 RepID=UPI00366E3701